MSSSDIFSLSLSAAKADEAARKKREKEELLRQEEADNVKLGGKVKKAPTVQKGKKTKKQDNLSLLEDALVKTADQKVKAQKRLERETKLERETNQKASSLQVPLDPLLANTETMLQVEAGRSINQQSMQMMASSGIDAALESMGLTGGVGKTSSMTYKDYEETMLPIVKQDFPGLRLTQYKEKVYQMWKKSPDNPNNQMPP
jgi:hypothetical protein